MSTTCTFCGHEKKYSRKWDAFYCEYCNIWLEGKCGFTTVEECSFECWKRPEKPLKKAKIALPTSDFRVTLDL